MNINIINDKKALSIYFQFNNPKLEILNRFNLFSTLYLRYIFYNIKT